MYKDQDLRLELLELIAFGFWLASPFFISISSFITRLIRLTFGLNLSFLAEKVDQGIVHHPAIVAPSVTVVDF